MLSVVVSWSAAILSSCITVSLLSNVVTGQTTLQQSSRDNHFPLSGYVVAKLHHPSDQSKQDLVLRMDRKSKHPGFCHTLRFVNLPPDMSSSPLMGTAEFTIDASRLYNDYYSWTNGKEYISFIPLGDNNAEGNWLVGPKPGVDSGYIFLSTQKSSMVPSNLERPGHYWKWLIKGEWKEQPQMKLVCTSSPISTKQQADDATATTISTVASNVSVPSHHFVEYFHNNEVLHSVVLTNINVALLMLLNQDDPTLQRDSSLALKASSSQLFSVLHCRKTGKWRQLSEISIIAAVGQPVLLSGGSSDLSRSYAAALVSDENAQGRFRLTFRNYKFSPSRPAQEMTLSTDGSVTLTGQRTHTFSITRVDKQAAAAMGEEEWSVLMGNDNVRAVTDFGEHQDRTGSSEMVISPLTATLQKGVLRSLKHDLSSIQAGDYVWIWFSGAVLGVAGSDSSPDEDRIDELLLRCLSRTESLLVFEYFPTHRQDQMRQSRLKKDTELVSMRLFSCAMESHGCSSVATMVTVSFKNSTAVLHGLVPIGRDALGYLHRHLVQKEGTPNGMSSCYMYHAAVSMPQALIYAAEILCVLIGSKPVTLIQYTTTSDHQWKFPLVPELVRAIVAAKEIFGDALDLKYDVFKYRNDETLVIYRTNRAVLAEALLPHREAQALHPCPYPREETRQADEELQIYNSAWNGLVLGYPEYFVQGYCESFHNSLEVPHKRQLYEEALVDFNRLMRESGMEPPRIRYGMDRPIADAHLESIFAVAQ